MHIDSSLWFDKEKKGFLGKGRIELLKNIDRYGSLSKAAKMMNMSYKAAWDSLNEMKNLSSEELIISSAGGSGGGGSRLTKSAKEYIKMYELLYKSQQEFLKAIESHTKNFYDLQTFLQRSSLRTSARNQLFGRVKEVCKGKISSKILILVDEDIEIVSSITNQSIKELGIKKGQNVFVLIKAPWIKISKEKIESENQINCVIKDVKTEDTSVELTLKVNPTISLIAVMQTEKFKALHVEKNEKIIASFKPNDAIIGV